MKVIDARSGREMDVGRLVQYARDDYVQLLGVEDLLLQVKLTLLTPSGVQQITMPVRWLHPIARLERVVFIPT